MNVHLGVILMSKEKGPASFTDRVDFNLLNSKVIANTNIERCTSN